MDDPAGADAAFEALGSEPRLRALRALVDDEGRPTERSFSELFAATEVDTTAGFSYHLRQLTDRYVRKDGETYELTYAGLRVARAVAAGTYTESVDSDPIPLDDDCPLCGEAALTATVADNVTTVACDACDRPVLELPFPPSGHDTHGDDLPRAFDVHHRHRIAGFSEGVCPECGGAVDAEAEAAGDPGPAVATFTCEACGARLRCPVTLATLNHPAVVAFYHDHGRDVRERPLWNVGDEWRERVVSEEPWCVRVTTRLDDEELQLFVARDATVVEHRRGAVEGRSEVTEESGVDGSEAAAAEEDGGSASA